MDTIWFRGDGGPGIGLGHLARLAALAEEARARGATCRFALNDDAQSRAFVEGRGLGPVEVVPPSLDEEIRFLAERAAAAPLVTDLRAKGPAFYRRLRDVGVWVCALDDMGEAIAAELVVNGDAATAFANYEEVWPPQRFLLGTRYVPLPPAFAAEPPAADDAGRGRLLITFGGADADDFSRRALRALADAEEVAVDLALGPAYPYVEEARRLAAAGPHRVEVHAPARDMLPLYRRARVALAAGGITQYELLSQGVPTISVPHVAREEAECAAFAAAGAVLTFPPAELSPGGAVAAAVAGLWADKERRRAMAAVARSLIDGRGAGRIIDAIEEMAA